MAATAALRSYEDLPYGQLIDYAGTDTYVTLLLLKRLWPVISKQPRYTEFYDNGYSREVLAPSLLSEALSVKHPALEFIVDMEVHGLPYDVPGNIEMGKRMVQEIDSLTEEIWAGIGERTQGQVINLDSSADLGKLLYSTYTMTPPFQTKGGDDSTSGDAILELAKNYKMYPWLKPLARRRNVVSMFRSFIETYVERWVKSDGCVHPEYNLFGTSSHRISSDNPNLLNLPRFDTSAPYDLRSLYLAPRGCAFLTLDFSSCEVKVLAALCGDEKMIEAILSGKDFHTYTASIINNIPYDEMRAVLKTPEAELDANPALKEVYRKFKKLRQAAKETTFNCRGFTA